MSHSPAQPERQALIERIAARVYGDVCSMHFPEASWETAGEGNRAIWRAAIRAGLLSALAEAGYVIVPRDPTEALIEVGYQVFVNAGVTDDPLDADKLTVAAIWRAMVEAAG